MAKCGQCGREFDADGVGDARVLSVRGIAQVWCDTCWENYTSKCNSCKVWYDYTLDACPKCGDTECEGGRF